ncbi:MAG: DUF4824 family protein [Trichloromonas sp.]|jgi:hypothetical protein|nr:DUF4824 family protein [Trichloromonas sp.]
MKRPHLLLALALILAVNAFALTGVARNRAGEPEAAMTLSERELWLVAGAGLEENSGVSLRLQWDRHASTKDWFNAEKMAELGIKKPEKPEGSETIRWPQPKKIFVVLEYEGESWRRFKEEKERKISELNEALARGEEREPSRMSIDGEIRSLKKDLSFESRLIPVDAGLDPGSLRDRYPDNRRHLIVSALTRAATSYVDGGEAVKVRTGEIDALLVSELHVPLKLTAPLHGLAPSGSLFNYRHDQPDAPGEPRYAVDVRWGRRFEPWVTAVRRIDKEAE